MEYAVLRDIIVLLALSVLTVTAFRRLHLPPIVGYLFVGAVAGPSALGWLKDTEATRFLGEIGVIFLLFMLGLELPVSQLNRIKGPLLGLGGMQVLIGTLSGAAIAWVIGVAWQGAIILGGALAMSSSAIVTKELMDKLELQTRHGQLALSVLLFQDLAAVPFIVLIPILAAGGNTPIVAPLLLALVKAAAAVTIMLVGGRWALRPLLHEVAAHRTGELFTLTTLLVALTAAWITSVLGLSLALGAFLAGMMLAETEFRHQIESDIRPFRDVLLGLFFITVGMQLNPDLLAPVWGWVLLLLAGIMFGKGALVALLTRMAGYSAEVAVRTGMVLAQGGEFGIALITLAVSTGLVSSNGSQPVLAALVLSMALAPIVVRYNNYAARHLSVDAIRVAKSEDAIAQAAGAFTSHIIICGYGRTGQSVAHFLKAQHIPFVALDSDIDQARAGWEAGDRVFYGNAEQGNLLQAAGLKRARALMVSFEDERSALKIVHTARAECQNLPILVRARDEATLERLLEAGATEGVPETLEASMMLAVELMLLLGLPSGEVFRAMNVARGERYRLLRGLFEREGLFPAETADAQHLRTVVLPASALAVGRQLHDIGLITSDVTVTALRRGSRYHIAEADLTLESGDALILHGTQDQLDAAEKQLIAE
jgi:monovalent cation:H+ antiporter-2, CPA2 family